MMIEDWEMMKCFLRLATMPYLLCGDEDQVVPSPRIGAAARVKLIDKLFRQQQYCTVQVPEY